MRQKEGSSYGSQRQIPECPAAKRDVFRRQARTAFRAADGCAGGLRFLCARRRHLFGGNLSQRHRLSAQGRSQGAAAQRRADDFASACGRRVRLRLPVFRRKLSGRDRRLQTVGCPYDLIIIHFGLNVVTDKTSDAMCRNYINRMKKVVATMREAYPQASIVIFSVPDRVQRSADGFHSLKGVLRLVDFQRVLASECNVAYLNVHQIMGGKNCMKKYVDEGLAAKDYTHLTYKGGKKIAGAIYQSILAGVENYRREQHSR